MFLKEGVQINGHLYVIIQFDPHTMSTNSDMTVDPKRSIKSHHNHYKGLPENIRRAVKSSVSGRGHLGGEREHKIQFQ